MAIISHIIPETRQAGNHPTQPFKGDRQFSWALAETKRSVSEQLTGKEDGLISTGFIFAPRKSRGRPRDEM
ncbi:hypothetical protein MKK84_33035 [Methylobacterium sp. E-065]|uniref:hypothetical protein n=1 Tax=Methylobacterium sp. E-065 TaxID=2836583 RepID=UPI001FBB3645|nr:hypothetical protein [Methylobacterium sp. E-065]MCJ2022175.1 hypothetical protein [Methylobacterium sp. E-065]